MASPEGLGSSEYLDVDTQPIEIQLGHLGLYSAAGDVYVNPDDAPNIWRGVD